MKILIIRTWPYQLNVDSYNVQEIGLAGALIRAGHQCDIVFYLKKGKSHLESRKDGITIYWRRGYNLLKNGIFPGIRKIAKEYDIVQVHEYDQIQSWILYTFPRNLKIVIYHGPYYSEFNKGYNMKCKLFDKTFLKVNRKVLNQTICLTKSPLAESFLRSKGFTKVHSLGVGMNPDSFGSDGVLFNKIAEEMPEEKFNIIYIGKMEKRRNIVFLLDVANQVAEKCNNVHFTMIGTGENEYMKEIESVMKEMEKEGRLSYWSSATQAELKAVYQKADLLLFPSNYEIYGMVLMEAMYFGVPCVSSMNGGAASLIENNIDGVILDTFEKDKWVQTLTQLQGNRSGVKKMSERASEKIKNEYTWDRLASKFVALYEEAMQQNKNGV